MLLCAPRQMGWRSLSHVPQMPVSAISLSKGRDGLRHRVCTKQVVKQTQQYFSPSTGTLSASNPVIVTSRVVLLQGSSSDAAGIQQGDELLSIDGVPLTSQSPFQAASLLQVRSTTRSAALPAC